MNENTQLHNAGYISDIFLISISPKRISYISCDAEVGALAIGLYPMVNSIVYLIKSHNFQYIM